MREHLLIRDSGDATYIRGSNFILLGLVLHAVQLFDSVTNTHPCQNDIQTLQKETKTVQQTTDSRTRLGNITDPSAQASDRPPAILTAGTSSLSDVL